MSSGDAQAQRTVDAAFADRYELCDELSSGPRRKAYLAEDRVLGRRVAIVLVTTDAPDGPLWSHALSAARTLARVSPHPNIVDLLDIGLVPGCVVLVTEFVSLTSLQTILRASGRLSVHDVIVLGRALCNALDRLHAINSTYGALRPECVLEARTSFKLDDTGLMDAEKRGTGEHDPDIVASYLAPEQIIGAATGPATDLYALGAVLYQALTGALPFRGDTPFAIRSQQLNTKPLAPSRLVPDCPFRLDQLLLSLLEFDPQGRPASAAAVAEALQAIADEGAAARQDVLSPLSQIARNTFVGRRRELGTFEDALRDAGRGTGSVILIEGGPGAGKSRLADEMATLARLRDAGALVGRCSEVDGAPAYWPWMEIGAGFRRTHDVEAVVRALGPEVHELQRVFPQFLGGRSAPPAADPPDPAQARFRLFEAAIEFMHLAASQRPIALFLDDAHRADESSLALLDLLARRVGGMRMVVVVSYRPPDESQKRFRAVLDRLRALPNARALSLAPFSEEDVRAYLVDATGVEPSAPSVVRLHELTDGNPFFLSETVNLLLTRGARDLAVDDEFPLPESVRAVLAERLTQATPDTVALLRIAAVEGREFHQRTLEQIAPAGVPEHLREAVDARLIEAGDGGRFRFAHALTRGVLFATIPAGEVDLLHGLVAVAIERTQDTGRPEVISRLAEHFALAARQDRRALGKAAHYLEEAARGAEVTFAWSEAVRHYDRWLALSAGDGVRLARVLEGKARAIRLAGMDPREAWRALMLAVSEYRSAGDPVGAARATLAALTMPTQPGRRRELADEALRDASSLDARVEGLLIVHRLRLRGLDPERAADLERRLYALRETAADAELEAHATLIEVDAAISSRRLDDAATLARVAAARYEALGDTNAAAAAVHSGYLALNLLGRLDESGDALQRLLLLATRARNWVVVGYAHMGLAGLHRTQGDVNAFAEAVTAIPEQNWTRRLYAAELAELAGDGERAAGLLPDPSLTAGVPAFDLIMRGARARILFHAGVLEKARSELDEWARVFSSVLSAGPTVIETMPETVAYPFPIESAIALADDCLVALGPDELARHALGLLEAAPHVRAAGESRGLDVLRGALARRLGDPEGARRWYQEGLAWAEGERCPLEVGRCLFGLAELAIQRHDEAEAVPLLDRAIGLFTEQNAGLYLTQALAARLDLGAPAGYGTTRRMSLLTQTARSDPLPEAAPDGTVTIMFTDIEASVRHTERLGDQRWLEVLHRHNAIVRAAVAAHHGFEVKTVGDAFMLAFGAVRDALACAVELQAELAASGLEISVRIGIHTGEPARVGGDFYGHHVNLASRITAAAAPGQILVSSVLRSIAEPAGDFRFRSAGTRRFEGIPQPQEVYLLDGPMPPRRE